MTQKDFIFIAQTIRGIQGLKERYEVAELFADRLAETNPRFKRELFIRKATGN